LKEKAQKQALLMKLNTELYESNQNFKRIKDLEAELKMIGRPMSKIERDQYKILFNEELLEQMGVEESYLN
jgi:hypothetical protein